MSRRIPSFSFSVVLLGLIVLFAPRAAARTWVVDPHGTGDAPTIAAGLDSAAWGDTVLVECGTYYESNLMMKSGVTLRSATGDPTCATIDAEMHGRVLACSYAPASVLEGLTFTNGSLPYGSGGALFVDYSSTVAVRNCRFAHNAAEMGGAVFIDAYGAATFDGCSFIENHASADGGAIVAMNGSNPQVLGCLFKWNTVMGNGGGLSAMGGGFVADCIFLGNYAENSGGAIHALGSVLAVETCVFDGNGAGSQGGGLASRDGAAPTVRFSTFAGNTAPNGSALASWAAAMQIENTIIAFNFAGEAVACITPFENLSVSCTDIFGNEGGDWFGCIEEFAGIDGNLSADPLFCGGEGGDPEDPYELRAGSPCSPESVGACEQIGARLVGCGFAVRWSGGGDGFSWSDPENWDPIGVPGPGDEVVIDLPGPYTVQFEGGDPIRSLAMGTLFGEQSLHIGEGTLHLAEGGWNASRIVVSEGAALRTDGLFENRDGATLVLEGGDLEGSGPFRNGGDVIKSDPRLLRAVSRIACAFENTSEDPGDGAVRVDEGVLAIEAPFDNAGEFSVSSGAEAHLDPGEGSLRQGEDFVNTGVVELEEDAVLSITGPSTVFLNQSDGLVDLLGGDILGEGLFANLGLVRKRGGRGLARATSRIACAFENQSDDPGDGAVTVDEGLLAIEGTFDNAGAFSVSSGAEALLDPGEGPLRGDLFRNQGIVTVGGGAALTIAGSATRFANSPGGVFHLEGGDLLGDGLFSNRGLVRRTDAPGLSITESRVGCRFENILEDPGDGAFHVEEGIVAVQDSFVNEGTVRADGGTEIRVETPSPLRPGRGAHLLNKGTMRIEPGAWFDLRATAWNTFLGVAEIFGTARVNEGAEWTNRGWTIVGEDAALLTLGGRRTPGVFANFGRIELRAGALVANGGAFENRENGVLGGIGVFDNGRGGVFLSEGILKPGLPAGDLAFLGDLPLSAESEVDVVIGGTEPGAFSRLLVTGEVAFAGALHVSLANGFEPALGDAFQVIAGSGPGAGRAFDCAGGLNLPGGLYLDPVEEGGTLSLVTIEDAGVNLPPLAADDAESTGVDQPIVLSVLSNDEDPDLDPLRILSLSVGGLAGFVAIDPGDTTVTYVPPAGFSGVESFRYVASDCRGGSDSALVTVRVASPPRAWRVPGDAATIQSGLDLAAPGDTVLVACGVYHENGIAMKPGVVLRGENSGGEPCATIDAGALGRALLVSGAGPGTVVRGLRFVNGLAPSGGAVLCVNGSTPLFENCAFTGNRAGTTGGGLSSDAASAPAFRKCTFAGNRAARGGGIYVGGGSLDVERTIVWGNCGDTDGAEIFLDDGASATFVLSDIDTSEIDGLGTYMWGAGSLSVDPMFCSPVACGDAPASAGNHRIDLRSPCFALLPEGSIGAFGPGCLGRLVFTSEEEARAYALVRTGVEEAADPSPLARRFDVLPNPARGSVTILYARPAGAPGALRVYDVAGRLVRSFPIGAPSGAVEWDGTNDAGARVAPGVYFLRLLSGSEVETRRLTLVR